MAVHESRACFLRRSVSSEGLRFGSLVLSGMWVMGSCDADEEVNIIGDWAASTRGGRFNTAEGSWTSMADRKVRIVPDMLIHR